MPKITSSLLWPIVVLLIAFGAYYLKPWETTQQETISVTAEGKVDVTPNVGKVTATIESKNPNIDRAREENQTKVSTVIEDLKQLGVEEKDIKTQNLSAGQGYSGMTEPLIYPAPPRPDTNVFSTSLEITVRNFENTDQVLSTLTKNGLTNLYGPQLTVDDKTLDDAKEKARADAVKNAKQKAKQLADASERDLGKVVKIAEGGDFGYPVPMMATSSRDLAEKAAQIQPGQNQVTVNLSVDFALD